jgi:undecaprenyl pyrophosphate phosphatase UppP
MRKGYVFILVFSLVIAIAQSVRYRLYTKRDLNAATFTNQIVQVVVLFLAVFIVGVLGVRWYYKFKDRK